ncbi:MAG: branched-chain amino acid ABC transporter permease [Rhodobacteraceae bacterium]|nr:MAG: branched-chain amino acid ABC transporter permease [Paracoccaceae bacterium]
MPDLMPFVVTGLALGGVYALAGIGIVVLFRATGELNFACGAIGAAAAMVTWQTHDWGLPILPSALAGVAVATLICLGYGTIVSTRVAQRSAMVKAVATLGLALFLMGLLYFIWGDTPRRLRLPLTALNTQAFGVRITGVRVLAFALVLISVIGITALLLRTRLGLWMRALADNRDLSALIGINVSQVTLMAWGLAGVLAGASGVLLGSLVRLEPGILTFMVVPAIAAAVVGLLRSLWLTLAGGLLIGLLEALATPFALIAPYRQMVPFLVAILVMLLIPPRLFDKERTS